MECLIDKLSIDWFWHLDSDVIVTDLIEKAEEVLGRRSEDELVTFANLNGLVPSNILRRLTTFALEIFDDEVLLANQRERFKKERFYALTEMNAVEWFFEHNKEQRWISPNIVLSEVGLFMDPAILHSNGIQTRRFLAFPNSEIKDVGYQDGSFYVKNFADGRRLALVTANCSWVPIDVPRWFTTIMRNQRAGKEELGSIRSSFDWRSKTIRNNFFRYAHVPVLKLAREIVFKVQNWGKKG